jgi:hypothetical protein
MTEYIDLDLSTLMDMLSKETSAYTRLLTEKQGTEEEFTQCKERIEQIQDAIHQKTAADQHDFQTAPEITKDV